MEDLVIGDRISLTFDDIPRDQIIATVARTLSDSEEGLGPESEDYICFWLEIIREGDTLGEISNLLLMTNGRYSLDGRFVTICKIDAN
jgi:hypothetical protein